MKILITSDWYESAINGVVTSITNLEEELTKRGHEVRILTLSENIHSTKEQNVISLGSVSMKLIYPGARFRIALTGGIVQEIMEWRPDIIHSQCEFNTFILAKKISKALNIPIVHTYHTVYEDYTHYFSPNKKWGRSMVAAFSRYIAERCDCMVAPTGKVENILKKYNVDCPIEIVPTGIDLEMYKRKLSEEEKMNMKRELGIPDSCRIALFVGRIAKEKNLEELISLWKNVSNKNIKFLIVGGGPHFEYIKELTEKYNLEDDIIFTGMIEKDDVWKYYQLGDLFMSASNSETQGLTYIEAMASGLPLLCRADECLDEVISEGRNGWQYHCENEFYSKFRRVTEKINNIDRDDIRAAAEKFSKEQFAYKIENIYRECIDRKKGSCVEKSA